MEGLELAFMHFGSCALFQDKLLWTGGRDTVAGPSHIITVVKGKFPGGWREQRC